MKNKRIINKFDNQANLYEKARYNKMLSSLREKIIPSASGNVLEVGVSVGANFPYYTDDVNHLTGVDFSSEMLKHAHVAASHYQISLTLMQADIDEVLFEPHSFDTIVSTLTVCGYNDPIATLKRYRSWCKDDGLVLFLEHGLSSNAFLSFTQKAINPIFKKISGCNSNRDIPKLIEKAGFEIIQIDHVWSEIISLIWAKPIK